jgi:hypothetical protein
MQDEELITRALQMMHNWGKVVYFDRDGLRDIVCLSLDFLTQNTLAKMFDSTIFSHEKGKIENKQFFNHWSDFAHPEAITALLYMMQQLHISFTIPEPHVNIENLKTLVPSLLPPSPTEALVKDFERDVHMEVNVKRKVILFFDFLPHEFFTRLLAYLHQTYLASSFVDQSRDGVILEDMTSKLRCRLVEPQEERHVIISNGNIKISPGFASTSPFLIVDVLASNEFNGYCAIQRILKLIDKMKREYYKGISIWTLTDICPVLQHDKDCASLVLLDFHRSIGLCISSDQRLTLEDFRQACEMSGLVLPSGSRDLRLVSVDSLGFRHSKL